MKNIRLIVFSGTILFLSQALIAPADQVGAEPPEIAAPAPQTSEAAADTILVKIDDQTISQADLDKETQMIERMMLQRGMPEQQVALMLSSLKPQILEGLLTQRLISNECAAKNIMVSAAEVKKEIEFIKANLPKTQSLEALLEKQGISSSMLEEQVKEQLQIEKLLKIAVSDEDVRNFYDNNRTRFFETVRARHILISTAPTDDAAKKTAKKERAEELRKELLAGGDFAKLAKENSDCPSKEAGGELIPPFRRGVMTPLFEDVAFSLTNNEISQVVETDFGYHIIQTLDHQIQPFDEVKGQIVGMLKGRQTQQKAEPLIQDLKAKAQITYLNGASALQPEMMMLAPPAANSEPEQGHEAMATIQTSPAESVAAPEKQPEPKKSIWSRWRAKSANKGGATDAAPGK